MSTENKQQTHDALSKATPITRLNADLNRASWSDLESRKHTSQNKGAAG
jgi:hypothetical protein